MSQGNAFEAWLDAPSGTVTRAVTNRYRVVEDDLCPRSELARLAFQAGRNSRDSDVAFMQEALNGVLKERDEARKARSAAEQRASTTACVNQYKDQLNQHKDQRIAKLLSIIDGLQAAAVVGSETTTTTIHEPSMGWAPEVGWLPEGGAA